MGKAICSYVSIVKTCIKFDSSYEPALQHVYGGLIAVRVWNVSCLLSLSWNSRVTFIPTCSWKSGPLWHIVKWELEWSYPSTVQKRPFLPSTVKKMFNTNRQRVSRSFRSVAISTTHHTYFWLSKNRWTTKSVCICMFPNNLMLWSFPRIYT